MGIPGYLNKLGLAPVNGPGTPGGRSFHGTIPDGRLALAVWPILDALEYWPMQARLCAADACVAPSRQPRYHVSLLTPAALLELGLSLAAKVLDLKGRFRCRGYGKKGGRSFRSSGRMGRPKLGFPGVEPRLSFHVSLSGVAERRWIVLLFEGLLN
jgi:hypothetical protein